jgi:SET domain-containing protein
VSESCYRCHCQGCLLGIPAFITNKCLHPGEQLSFDYGGVYSDPLTRKRLASEALETELSGRLCYCGASNCRGALPGT